MANYYRTSTPTGVVDIEVDIPTEDASRLRYLDVDTMLDELGQTPLWAARAAGKPANPVIHLGGHRVRVRVLPRLGGGFLVSWDFI